ncbi:hypothetical protein [Shewanella baltica]|uniref:hypothetical protein n=1 Tax=Shewanella baltica TaxID=62322 RepID=UPI00217D3F48|nr:hypothetical protein [Shewanella baltica]MCS6176746.1 hypothetical protein [Shewanella baltica]
MKTKTAEIPQSLDTAQDVATPEGGNAPEWKPEISPELLGMDNQGQAEQVDDDGTKKLPKTQVEQAEILATEVGGALAMMLQGATGRDYGLNEQKVKEAAKGVAPCLVKYGYTEMGLLLSKWGVEIQAAISLGGLAFGIWSAHRKYKAEDEAAELEATAKREGVASGNQSE